MRSAPDDEGLAGQSGSLPGLHWNPEGMVGLSGDLARLLEAVDRALLGMADALGAEPRHYAPLLAAGDMKRMAGESSFPHLVTLPIALDTDPRDLEAFRGPTDDSGTGPWVVGRTAPVRTVLAPAACYALYPSLEGAELGPEPRNVTVCATCFRQQTHYQPLRRQWAFHLREIVHFGSEASAAAFTTAARGAASALARSLGLDTAWVPAGDPFFDVGDARKVAASHAPTKDELVLDGRLALGSVNRHFAFFGDVFSIRFRGEAAHSACAAFGLERWLYAILARYGPDPAGWPL